MLPESELFRKSIFLGPLSFAKQRYEYIKMKGEEMNYSDYMSKGYMFEECRKANIIMQEKYNELYEWYRRNNPDNYDVSDFEKQIALSYAAENYAREIIYYDYVTSSQPYYVLEINEEEEE